MLLCKLQLNNSYRGTALHNNIQQEQKHHDKIIIIIHRAVMNSLLTLHNSAKKYQLAIDWTVHFKTAKCHSVPCPFNHAEHTRLAGNSQIIALNGSWESERDQWHYNFCKTVLFPTLKNITRCVCVHWACNHCSGITFWYSASLEGDKNFLTNYFSLQKCRFIEVLFKNGLYQMDLSLWKMGPQQGCRARGRPRRCTSSLWEEYQSLGSPAD